MKEGDANQGERSSRLLAARAAFDALSDVERQAFVASLQVSNDVRPEAAGVQRQRFATTAAEALRALSLYELDPLRDRDLAKGASLRRQAHAALTQLAEACASAPERCHIKMARQARAQARHVSTYVVGSGMQEPEEYANTLERWAMDWQRWAERAL